MYLITGATGNIGKIVARELMLRGKKVRAVSRHEDKMKELYDMGAEAFIGDLTEKKFTDKLFEGIDAAYCMIPTDLKSEDIREYQHRIGSNYAEAIRTYGTRHVILLSSVGAHMRKGCGIVDGMAETETFLAENHDTHVLNLRAAFFMENLYSQIPMIKNSGIIGSAVKGDLKFPLVATSDIADVVTDRLLSLDFTGNTTEYVLGPRDLSFQEITRILSRAMDIQDLHYVQFTGENARQGLIKEGISESVAEAFSQLWESFNTGEALNGHTRTPENTTPTTFEEFARKIVYAYHQMV